MTGRERSNQSILKEISPGISLEGLMLMLKLQYFGHLMQRADSFEKKSWGQEKGMTEDEMAGWHHWLSGHGFGWTLGVGDGQGGLACCGSWGRKELDTTEQLNWTELRDISGCHKRRGCCWHLKVEARISHPWQRILKPKMSIMPRLRNYDLT